MIGSLELRFSLMSWFNSPLRVTVEDLLFIVGPSLQHFSNDDSFEEDSPEQPYDPDSMLNIFNGSLRIHKRPRDFTRLEDSMKI